MAAGSMHSSPFSFSALLLLLIAFALSDEVTHVVASNAAGTTGVSSQKLAMIHRYLENINKPAVKSIKSPDGDIVDCVLMEKQLALDHPLLKDHKIQRVAPEMPEFESNRRPRNQTAGRAWQTWNHIGSCPDGTVSTRRTTADDVLRAKSLSRFGKKNFKPKFARDLDNPAAPANHEYAVASSADQQQAYGTKATIDVWDPLVQVPSEFSLSQLWIVAGSYPNNDLNTVEAGWQVFPQLYGDNKPRLFVYWTRDAYGRTGCYNTLCSGFVQTSNQIAVGVSIPTISVYNGDQHDITLLVWKDQKSGNWWLQYQNTTVGYWPAELFTYLANYGTSVQWGGEIVNTMVDGRHTTTQMGSGHFAEEGLGKAGYFRDVAVVNSDNTLVSTDFSTIAGKPNCYDIRTFSDDAEFPHFFYGGPGRNPNCP